MKSMLTLFLGIFCMACQAQLNQDTIDAMTWGAKTKVTFQVVDSRDSPVTNAQFSVGWSDDYTNRHKEQVAKTDKNGLFVLEVKSRGTFTYFVEKDEYYRSQGKHAFDVAGENHVKDGRWEPWNPTVKVVLKEIRKPIPMFVKSTPSQMQLPRGKKVGFDFDEADLVAPYGKGKRTDILFQFDSETPEESRYATTNQIQILAVSEQDGFLSFSKDMQSRLKSRYSSPTNGFAPAMEYRLKRDQGNPSIVYENTLPRDRDDRNTEYLVFRIRVEMDDRGNIVHRTINMKNTIVLLFVFSTALSTPISAAEPEQGLSLGSKTWAPITNGFVFFDGEFIPPPYTVSRVENAVYINGRFLETSASWPPMKKVSVPVSVPETDPEMPDTITETTSKYDPAYSKFISDKRRYLFAKHGKEKGIDMMVEVYRKMPNVAKAEREKDVWGGVYVRLKSGEESRIDMIPPGRREDNLTREQALSMVNSLCEIYTGGLSRNDYFMFGIPHQTGLLIDGGTLYLLADGLRTAKDEAEFLAIMKTNPLPSGISEKGFRNIYRHRDGLSKWEALLPSKNKETKAAIVAPPTEPWSPESRIMVRPKLDSTLGERTWTPVTNGLVFINGEFIPPPYVVTRKGNHLYLNGDYYVAGVRWPSSGTWAYPIPAQGLDLDIPASITKQTTLFDATLSHYLDETRNIMITVYGEEEGARHLVETYKKLPCVKEAVIDTNTLCTIFVTWMSGETYRINEFPPERWAGELSRKTVVRVVDDVGEELAEGLEQNRCFTVGTLPRRGMQEAFAKALPALAHALRTAKDEAISWRS